MFKKQVCELKKCCNNDWTPSCQSNSKFNVTGVAWFEYCPYCGKRIKVVEK